MVALPTQTKDMKKVCLERGRRRQICVSRKAIEYNLRKGTRYPTIIVVENGRLREFHSAKLNGELKFDPTRKDLPAAVFIETYDEVEAFIDPFAPSSFTEITNKKSLFGKIKTSLYRKFIFIVHLPGFSCITLHHYDDINANEIK